MDSKSKGIDPQTSAGEEEPAVECSGSNQAPDTTQTWTFAYSHELGGATGMGTRANSATAPVPHDGLSTHQKR